MQQTVAAAYTTHFVVLFNAVGLDTLIPDGKGNGLAQVGAYLYGRGVVGHHSDAHRLVPSFHLFVDGAHHAAVKVLDGAKLQVEVAIVARLVAGFYMQEHKVVVAQGFNGGGCFAFIVGVG